MRSSSYRSFKNPLVEEPPKTYIFEPYKTAAWPSRSQGVFPKIFGFVHSNVLLKSLEEKWKNILLHVKEIHIIKTLQVQITTSEKNDIIVQDY